MLFWSLSAIANDAETKKIKQGCVQRCTLTSLSPIPRGFVVFDVGGCSKAISSRSYIAAIIDWMEHLIATMFIECHLKDARCKINTLKHQIARAHASNLVKMINNLLLLLQLRVQFKILLVFFFFCTLGNKIDTACCIFWQLEKWVLMLSKLFLHDQTASCSTVFTLVRKEKNRTGFQHFSRSGGGDRMWPAN